MQWLRVHRVERRQGRQEDKEFQDPKITRVRICNVLNVGRLAQVTGSKEVSGNQDICSLRGLRDKPRHPERVGWVPQMDSEH